MPDLLFVTGDLYFTLMYSKEMITSTTTKYVFVIPMKIN